MDDFASDTDSDYTSYWRDWVSDLSLREQLLQRKAEGSAHDTLLLAIVSAHNQHLSLTRIPMWYHLIPQCY